jgi:hypothetical protein
MRELVDDERPWWVGEPIEWVEILWRRVFLGLIVCVSGRKKK